jgi:hypothetical protein
MEIPGAGKLPPLFADRQDPRECRFALQDAYASRDGGGMV